MATKKEILKDQVATVHSMLKPLIDDITEQESLVTIGSSPNHICWQTGHLVFTAYLAATALGGKVAVPDGWMKIFERGAKEPDGSAAMPTMSAVREELYRLQAEVIRLIDASDDDRLDTKVQIAPGWEDSPTTAVLFFCAHDFYHGGQIALIRRELGRQRVFG